jgi:hypothetical protein
MPWPPQDESMERYKARFKQLPDGCDEASSFPGREGHPFGPGAGFRPMDRVAVRSIVMTWDPRGRLAHISFTAPTEATGEDARVLTEQLAAWVGPGQEPFGLLGDGGKLARLDAAYRSTWGRFFKAHRGHVHLGFYNMSPLVRLAAEMFRLGTGIDMKAFETEQEARAWLRQNAIGA